MARYNTYVIDRINAQGQVSRESYDSYQMAIAAWDRLRLNDGNVRYFLGRINKDGSIISMDCKSASAMKE